MSSKPKTCTSAFIRQILKRFCALSHEEQMEFLYGHERCSIGWGMTRVKYQIMTDANGVKWCVPESEELRRFNPEDKNHTFDRITISNTGN